MVTMWAYIEDDIFSLFFKNAFQLKQKILYCGVYNIRKSNTYDNHSVKDREGKVTIQLQNTYILGEDIQY